MLLYEKQKTWTLFNPFKIAKSLFENRRLLGQFTRRNIELQHKGSFLGLFWTILSPILLFGIYAFVFMAIFNSRYGTSSSETRTDYAIGLFLSLTLLQLFQESIAISPTLIVQNPNFVKKVVFPLEILPAAAVGAAAFRCSVSLLLVVVAEFFWGAGLFWSSLWLMPIAVCLVLMSLGAAWVLSAVGVFFRDATPLVQFTSVFLMFASAVFYSFQSIPLGFRFLRFNPLLVIVEASRGALLWGRSPSISDMLYISVVSITFAVCGYAFFEGLKPAYPDVL